MVRKHVAIVLMAVTGMSSAVLAEDAQRVIGEASTALGVANVKSVQYSATGFDFAFGQAPTPGAAWPRFIDKSYTRTVDFEHPGWRLDRVRLQGENPPRGGGGQPIVGEQAQSQSLIVDSKTSWAQQLDIWLLPQGFLKAAGHRAATVKQETLAGKPYRVVSFIGDNGAEVNGYIDEHNRIERVETWIDTPVLGDTAFEADYSDYRQEAGGQFPRHILQKEGGFPILDLTVSEVTFNVPLSVEPSAAGAAAVAANGSPNPPAKSERLGDGVYLITGGYAVVAIEFKDYITLLEPGQSEARALAVIAEAKRLFPGKPIKYVVNTHSHFDHSGGLRAFVAEGATILTYQTNKAYLQKVLSQPHTLSPDEAQRSGKKPRVEGIGDKKVLTDGVQVVDLYHLQHFLHHDGMVVAYLPKEKVLFEADAFNPQAATATPPSPPNPNTVSLYENIQRLHLDVQRVIPVHYPADEHVIAQAELTRWAGKGTPN